MLCGKDSGQTTVCAVKQIKSRGLQEIPGVGKSIEVDLQRLGIARVDQLRGRDPRDLYERMMQLQGGHIDRCMLYVLRCAVYYAEGGREPGRLLWWHWKDECLPRATRRERN